jgi:chaperone modulatory protein CbpM
MNKMHEEIILTGYLVEDTVFTLTEIRQRFSIDDNIMHDMLEHGLIEPKKIPTVKEICLDQQALQRIQTALHLYHDLGVNIAGAALVLDELDILQHHLKTHR